MRRLFLLVLSFCALAGYAQQFKKIKVDLSLGYASPTESSGGTKAGVAFTLEPHYRVTDEIAAGIRIEGAAIGQFDSGASDAKVAVLTSYCATGEYYLGKADFRPFVGVGAGLYKMADVKVNSSGGAAVTKMLGETKFGFFPRVGFEYGHFRLNGEYNIIDKGGYIAGKLGFFFGGGRK